MDNSLWFDEKTDVDINVLHGHLQHIYEPIRARIMETLTYYDSTIIRDLSLEELSRKENFKILFTNNEGWVVRFPTEQHKLQYLLKHL